MVTLLVREAREKKKKEGTHKELMEEELNSRVKKSQHQSYLERRKPCMIMRHNVREIKL